MVKHFIGLEHVGNEERPADHESDRHVSGAIHDAGVRVLAACSRKNLGRT